MPCSVQSPAHSRQVSVPAAVTALGAWSFMSRACGRRPARLIGERRLFLASGCLSARRDPAYMNAVAGPGVLRVISLVMPRCLETPMNPRLGWTFAITSLALFAFTLDR